MTSEVALNKFGDLSGTCETFNVAEDDRLKTVSIGYSNDNVQ